MSKGVAITGMGVISAIGNNASENYKSLISGAIGISKISQIDTVHADQILVGEIKTTNAEFEKQLDLEEDTYSRSPILAIIAAKEAIQQAGVTIINICNSCLLNCCKRSNSTSRSYKY